MDIRIANINISFLGANPVLDCLKREFSLFPKAEGDPDLVFEFVDSSISPEKGSAKIGNIYVGDFSLFVEAFMDYKIIGPLHIKAMTRILLNTKFNSSNTSRSKIIHFLRGKIRRFF